MLEKSVTIFECHPSVFLTKQNAVVCASLTPHLSVICGPVGNKFITELSLLAHVKNIN